MAKSPGFYELFPYPLNHRHGGKFRQYLCRLLEETFRGRARPKNILDAGCGTGAVTRLLAELIPGAQILAVDQSATSIRIAKKMSLRNVEFRRRDLCNGLGWDRQFDFVFCHGVIHHVDRVKVALRALIASVSPGGLLYIWLYSRYGRVEIEQIRQIEQILSRSQEKTSVRLSLVRAIRRHFPELSDGENKLILAQRDQSDGDCVQPREEDLFICDRYLNPIARHFSVNEAAELFARCGLKLKSIPQFDWIEIGQDLIALKKAKEADILKYYAICEMLYRPSGIGYILRRSSA